MKKGFTLIEMLVVVAVIGVLMGVVFRLSSVADSQSRTITTATRLQKIENCLSGYYAAFGSYPPVKLYGSRDIYLKVGRNGVQEDDGTGGALEWPSIEAACRSQPLSCDFPPSNGGDGKDNNVARRIARFSEELKERCTSGEYPRYSRNNNSYYDQMTRGFSAPEYSKIDFKKTDWRDVQLFRFGLMSYLLPRYLVMMQGDRRFFGVGAEPAAQWTEMNDTPVDAMTGDTMDWREVVDCLQLGSKQKDRDQRRYASVACMPTQAVCGRWIANLEKECYLSGKCQIFGVELSSGRSPFELSGDEDSYPPSIKVYGEGSLHFLDSVTVRDGWDREFYYYSPNGYQSYTLWSAGKNGYTFPPWISRDRIDTRKQVRYATQGGRELTIPEMVEDDIVKMNH